MFGVESSNGAPKFIPGYTGHIPNKESEERFGNHNTGFYIPGYAGFVKGVKSENMYGTTFGESSAISIENQYYRGHDIPPPIKFISVEQESFIDQQKLKDEQFFSFTRLTKNELKQTLSDVMDSRARSPRHQLLENANNKIEVSYEQIVQAREHAPQFNGLTN